jgi:hypothetical protein
MVPMMGSPMMYITDAQHQWDLDSIDMAMNAPNAPDFTVLTPNMADALTDMYDYPNVTN